jgi:hypothetical protein
MAMYLPQPMRPGSLVEPIDRDEIQRIPVGSQIAD